MIELIWTEKAQITKSGLNCVDGIGAFAAMNVSTERGRRGRARIIADRTGRSASIRSIRALWTHTMIW